jgi:hypothetical protein
MPEFEFWYDETRTYKAWFTAKDREAALELLDRVQDGDLDLENLPDFANKDKGYEIAIDSTLGVI